MKREQRGITLMSFLMVLVLVGFFALIGMKLFPMYSEYYNLKGVMKDFAAQANAASMTPAQIESDLFRRFNIAYVESVKRENIKIVRTGRTAQLNIAYEVRTPLIGNLDAVGKFDYTVDLSGTPAE